MAVQYKWTASIIRSDEFLFNNCNAFDANRSFVLQRVFFIHVCSIGSLLRCRLSACEVAAAILRNITFGYYCFVLCAALFPPTDLYSGRCSAVSFPSNTRFD